MTNNHLGFSSRPPVKHRRWSAVNILLDCYACLEHSCRQLRYTTSAKCLGGNSFSSIRCQTHCDVLRDLVPFVQFQKLEGGGVTKSNTPNGCFSPFWNCTNGTKSRKASHIIFTVRNVAPNFLQLLSNDSRKCDQWLFFVKLRLMKNGLSAEKNSTNPIFLKIIVLPETE